MQKLTLRKSYQVSSHKIQTQHLICCNKKDKNLQKVELQYNLKRDHCSSCYMKRKPKVYGIINFTPFFHTCPRILLLLCI